MLTFIRTLKKMKRKSKQRISDLGNGKGGTEMKIVLPPIDNNWRSYEDMIKEKKRKEEKRKKRELNKTFRDAVNGKKNQTEKNVGNDVTD